MCIIIKWKISNFAPEMCSISDLKIDFHTLPEGETVVALGLNEAFFASIEDSEISQGDVHVDVSIRKTIHFSDLVLHTTGTVEIICDRCLDPMDQPIDAEQRLTVKFGSERTEEDDIITVTEDDSVVDLSWYIYESIILSLPVKHVHAPGKCNPAMIKMLNEHSATRSDDTAEQQTIDPRWAKLSQLNLDE